MSATKPHRIEFDPPLDPGIEAAVLTLQAAGIETFESCEGGPGHAYPEPTVRFHGERQTGLEALAAALRAGLPVAALRRVWPVIDQEPTGPWWELTFSPTKASSSPSQDAASDHPRARSRGLPGRGPAQPDGPAVAQASQAASVSRPQPNRINRRFPNRDISRRGCSPPVSRRAGMSIERGIDPIIQRGLARSRAAAYRLLAELPAGVRIEIGRARYVDTQALDDWLRRGGTARANGRDEPAAAEQQ